MARQPAFVVLLAAAITSAFSAAARAEDAGPFHPPTVPSPAPVVHLLSNHLFVKLQVESEPDNWRDVCVAPCDRAVEPATQYRVAGRSLVPSDPFSLPPGATQMTLDAHLGSRPLNVVGKILTPIGIALLIAGPLLYYAGSHQPDTFDSPIPGLLHFYGVAATAGGAVLTILGPILWASSTSHVDVQ